MEVINLLSVSGGRASRKKRQTDTLQDTCLLFFLKTCRHLPTDRPTDRTDLAGQGGWRMEDSEASQTHYSDDHTTILLSTLM